MLNPPDEEAWHLPGGGLCPDESLADCVIREVFEETGIQIRVLSIAFLREWVVPKYCVLPNGKEQAGFGLEVYMYAFPVDDAVAPRAEHPGLRAPCWVPLSEISSLPLWPKEIKALAAALIAGQKPSGVPSFVSKLDSPLEVPAEAIAFNVPLV